VTILLIPLTIITRHNIIRRENVRDTNIILIMWIISQQNVKILSWITKNTKSPMAWFRKSVTTFCIWKTTWGRDHWDQTCLTQKQKCGHLRRITNVWCKVKIYFSLTHRAEPLLRSCPLCNHSRTSQRFMEPEGSLSCSQEPSTGLYPESDQSNPYHPILSLYDPF
jgi:hypothetical protein